MVFSSMRRLLCFYCNSPSAQKYKSGLSEWKCEHCEAINYLDSRGEITDPPSGEATAQSKCHYVTPIERSISPTLPPLAPSIFCQRCLNNQHLVVQSLANYLPTRSDPRYDEFEAMLPAYQKSLEDRYPQVCVDCEPKVRDRIKLSGYMAKTDHLRRMRENTKNAMVQMKRSWQRTSLLTLAGSTVWFLSILIHVVCHGLGALSQEDNSLSAKSVAFKRCIVKAYQHHKVDGGCGRRLHSITGWALALSLLTIWWNPVMRRRWIDRAVGLKEFYKLQLVIAFARFVVWYTLGRANHLELELNAVKAIHLGMLVLNIITPFISYRTVYIAKSPRVTFQETYEPLVVQPERSDRAPRIPQRPTPPYSQASDSPSPSHHYRHQLREPTRKTEPPPYHPPTPPPEEDEDEMDLDTPEKHYDLKPTIHRRIDPPQWNHPTPFYGKLPPAPVSMERQLRNPPNKPSFKKTSPEMQESFFQNMTRGRLSGSGINPSEPRQSPIRTEMREPRLFTEQDRAAQETGLESWFSDFFSLGEPISGIAQTSAQKVGSEEENSPTISLWSQILPILSLGLAAYLWNIASTHSRAALPLYFMAVGIAAIVSGTRLRSIILSNIVNHSDVLLCLLELFGALAIGFQIRQALLAGYRIDEELGSFPLWYFGFMIFQESSSFISAYRQNARFRNLEPTQEYLQAQQQPPQRREVSPPREPKSLPMDQSLTQHSHTSQPSSSFSYSSQRQNHMTAQPGFQQVPDSFEERVTRSQTTKQSPGSQGFAGLSLGLDSDTPLRRSTRAKGKVVNPWEVGRM